MSSSTIFTFRALSSATPRIPRLLPHEVIRNPSSFVSNTKSKLAGGRHHREPIMSYQKPSLRGMNRSNVSKNIRIGDENKRLQESFASGFLKLSNTRTKQPHRFPTQSARASRSIVKRKRTSALKPRPRQQSREPVFKHRARPYNKRKRSEAAKDETTTSKQGPELHESLQDECITDESEVTPRKRRRRRVAPIVFRRDTNGQYRLRDAQKEKPKPQVSSLAEVKAFRKKILLESEIVDFES